ncbi:ABC transporter permease [Devosia epidermidihirudinis]|uniref:ABC transporter permease n=1 Tax=Devosia epidermidihirudinis TaxID=1293439 RepID=A0A0F5QGG6_9HYPH|nr:MFS transporter [Devosia epidermidihirudinis]KKC39846.1 ABC transporter permease [Devosia epidermidihirudinis]
MTDTTLPLDGIAVDHDATSATTSWGAKTWLAMLAMLATSFALVSAEFLPAGLLTPMAADLGISEGTAGQVVTATALVGAITALLSNVLIGTINRKAVLLGLSALAVVSNLLSAYATDFWLLLVGRAGLGIALSAFWALSMAVVVRLVGTKSMGRGVAMVSLGVSLATIAAPSMGALISDWIGWRHATAITAGLAGFALLLQLISLPSLPASASNSLGDVLGLTRRRGVQLGMLAILMLMAGHMTGSVYVRPFLEQVTSLSTGMIALVLGGFGIAAVVGTVLAGRLADIDARKTLALTATIMALSALALVLWGASIAAAFVFVASWGLAFGMAPVSLQANLSRSAPDALEGAGSLMVVSFQVAITLGAVIGGYVVDTFSATANMSLTAILAALTLLLALSQRKA